VRWPRPVLGGLRREIRRRDEVGTQQFERLTAWPFDPDSADKTVVFIARISWMLFGNRRLDGSEQEREL
jgi:hypothetical protein